MHRSALGGGCSFRLLGTAFVMRPSSVGGGRILRRTLSVCLSVRLSVRPVRGSSFVILQ